MKQQKIECKVLNNDKADIQSTQRLLYFKTIGSYLIFTHQITTSLTRQAKVGGVCDEEMQNFIDSLLNSQSFQDQIIKHAGIFLENQKAIEESLKKD